VFVCLYRYLSQATLDNRGHELRMVRCGVPNGTPLLARYGCSDTTRKACASAFEISFDTSREA
jgi:hypothetical protein